MNDRWDAEYDVVVVGYGYSGGMAAIAAEQAGARVAIFEKQRHFGGNSIMSGGSVAVARDPETTLRYLQQLCMDTTDEPVLRAFAEGMVWLPTLVQDLANATGFKTTEVPHGAPYTFAGFEQIYDLRVSRTEAYSPFPWLRGEKAGATLFASLIRYIEMYTSIRAFLECPVVDLIADSQGQVTGCHIVLGSRTLRVRANRAVVVCTGGFERNERMLKHFFQVQPIRTISSLGNTGDGIIMGQKLGAAIWHMWNVCGTYGFAIPGLEIGIPHRIAGQRSLSLPMPWIVVDRFGRRFMNECPPAPGCGGMLPLGLYDADLQDFPRVPSYVVFDEVGRQTGPLGRVVINDESVDFSWSPDNIAEVEAGYIHVASSVEELAQLSGIDPVSLVGTVADWNAACESHDDKAFGRPPGTMMPLRTGPFYAAPVMPVVYNTQGGLMHNARQQVLDSFGRPIPRLYKAGENGSLWGHLYLLGGNNSECLVGGWIAGENAANAGSWSEGGAGGSVHVEGLGSEERASSRRTLVHQLPGLDLGTLH